MSLKYLMRLLYNSFSNHGRMELAEIVYTRKGLEAGLYPHSYLAQYYLIVLTVLTVL
jgi:hypothetical protein